MTYEELIEEYAGEVNVIEHDIKENPIVRAKGGKGFYYRSANQKVGTAIIDSTLSSIDKKCTLAEELGHHYTSCGNILSLKYGNAEKQERIAREWGAIKLVSPQELSRYYLMYEGDITKIAEEMQLTPETIHIYLKYISRKKGYK